MARDSKRVDLQEADCSPDLKKIVFEMFRSSTKGLDQKLKIDMGFINE